MTAPAARPAADTRVLANAIRDLIIHTARTAPRSRQVAIGPSEVGEPCVRRLAYKLLDWPRPEDTSDPWASIIGTAVHAWMAELFEGLNADGRNRYRVEERVEVRPGLVGASDLYDRATGTVWDWKVVGTTSLSRYRQRGPGEQYRVQAHLYGLGQENAGEKPRRVAICFLPRHHVLAPHVWTQPYDRAVAEEALARLDTIRDLVAHLDPEATPAHWAAIPTSPAAKCGWCPWHRPRTPDLAAGCPGHHPTPGTAH